MRVFVAGASGAVGRPLLRQLTAAGHAVVGMTRSNPDAVRAAGAEPVIADAYDADAVQRAVEGARPDVVVNELTDLDRPFNPRKYDEWLASTNRLRREGTKNLADAARAAGASKFISQSVAFFYTFEPGLKTEESPPLGADVSDAAAALHDLDRITLAAPGGIVLRYGFFYGPGTSYAADGSQIETIRKRQLPIVGAGRGAFPFVHVDDAASATVAALERGEPGVYNVVDDEPARASEWISGLAQLVGAKKPLRVPVWLGRLLAGDVAVRMMTQARGASNEKAKWVLDWRPRFPGWREGFPHALGATPTVMAPRRNGAAA